VIWWGVRERPADAAGSPPAAGEQALPPASVPARSAYTPWPFRCLAAASVCNQFEFWMQQVGLGWLVLELTNSSLQLGLASFLRGVPMLLLSPVSGVLVDRLDRRGLALLAHAVLTVCTLALAVLIGLHWIQPWHAFLVAALSGVAVTLSFPARQALIPSLVPRSEVSRAVATMAAGQNGARVIAPGVAGALISVSGLATSFFVQSLPFLASYLLIWAIPRGPRPAPNRSGMLSNMLDGFAHIRTNPRLLGLMVLAVVPTVLALPYQQLLPVFARDVYDAGPSGLGILLTANSVGAFVGALVATSLMGMGRRGHILLVGGVGVGVGLVLLGLAPSYAVGLAVVLLTGGAFSVYNATNNALIHEATTDAFRGRVMSVYLMTWSLMPLGTLPAGALADHVGAPLTVALGGGLCAILVAIVWLATPALREIR
jgi:MFS family permease